MQKIGLKIQCWEEIRIGKDVLFVKHNVGTQKQCRNTKGRYILKITVYSNASYNPVRKPQPTTHFLKRYENVFLSFSLWQWDIPWAKPTNFIQNWEMKQKYEVSLHIHRVLTKLFVGFIVFGGGCFLFFFLNVFIGYWEE